MGYVPQELRKWAIAEAAAQQDILLLQTEDAVQYAHVGDSFVSDSFHPELRKIILSMRLLFGIFNPKFVMLCDDDAFVSIPSLFELLNLLPTERVYLGNMIDTVPQRDGRQDLAMDFSTYVSAPSRMPLFAHGMAYIISSDIADLIADLGLQMRGHDTTPFASNKRFGDRETHRVASAHAEVLGKMICFLATQNLHYFSDVHRFVDHEDFTLAGLRNRQLLLAGLRQTVEANTGSNFRRVKSCQVKQSELDSKSCQVKCLMSRQGCAVKLSTLSTDMMWRRDGV
eukprot:2057748-Amphidinium_carterae.1